MGLIMATQEEVKTILSMLEEFHSFHTVEKLDDTNRGIVSILRCLSKKDQPITAGEISERTGVSTARTAVLLRKMSARNMIITGNDPSDARKTLVSLSDYGKELLHKKIEEHKEMVSIIIDRIGFERTKEFMRLSNEIKSIFYEIIKKKKSLTESNKSKKEDLRNE